MAKGRKTYRRRRSLRRQRGGKYVKDGRDCTLWPYIGCTKVDDAAPAGSTAPTSSTESNVSEKTWIKNPFFDLKEKASAAANTVVATASGVGRDVAHLVEGGREVDRDPTQFIEGQPEWGREAYSRPADPKIGGGRRRRRRTMRRKRRSSRRY
jgi:hypothetical protein